MPKAIIVLDDDERTGDVHIHVDFVPKIERDAFGEWMPTPAQKMTADIFEAILGSSERAWELIGGKRV